jgi:hypothetical protein
MDDAMVAGALSCNADCRGATCCRGAAGGDAHATVHASVHASTTPARTMGLPIMSASLSTSGPVCQPFDAMSAGWVAQWVKKSSLSTARAPAVRFVSGCK